MAQTSESTYDAARRVLKRGREEAFAQYKAESGKRWRIVGALVAAWLVISIALVVGIGNDMLVVSVVGFAVVIAVGVFYLIPSVMGKGGLQEMFDQYAAQLDLLESAGVDLPMCTNMEELAPAVDYATALHDEKTSSPEV